MKIVVVDYGSGNLRSAAKALERVANGPVEVTAKPEAVSAADYLVVPGQGAFADCLAGVKTIDGLYEAITDFALNQAKPYLGICVGMQMLATTGHEYEPTAGLGWIPGDIRRITPSDTTLKIPHMGWNSLDVVRQHPVLDGIPTGPDGLDAYFVHSYHLVVGDRADLIATTDYGGPVSAIVGRDNMVGTQFHPEKSQALGLALIGNFLTWTP